MPSNATRRDTAGDIEISDGKPVIMNFQSDQHSVGRLSVGSMTAPSHDGTSAMRELGRLTKKDWRLVVLSMPIPCVDVIVQKRSKVLMGFRAIDPYRNVWALPGGRILKHESPEDAVRRILAGIGLKAKIKCLVGVFPVRFPRHTLKRYDITLCYRSEWLAGEPKPDSELVRLIWVSPKSLPTRTGGNYRKMIERAFSQS